MNKLIQSNLLLQFETIQINFLNYTQKIKPIKVNAYELQKENAKNIYAKEF